MGTILEGDWDAVMAVVGECFRELQKDCRRISMNLKMDYRAGSEPRPASKVDAVGGSGEEVENLSRSGNEKAGRARPLSWRPWIPPSRG
jgi:hypothetical protein